MKYLDYETIVNDAKEIINGNEDYVYIDPDGFTAAPISIARCRYFDPETGQPSCLVGHVLAKHGVEYTDIPNFNSVGVNNVFRIVDLNIAPPALTFLGILQSRQDVGWTWGDALKEALSFEHGGF